MAIYHSRVTAIYLFFNLPDITEVRSDSYIKMFITLLGVGLVFRVSSQLDILYKIAVKLNYANNGN